MFILKMKIESIIKYILVNCNINNNKKHFLKI